VVLAMTVFPALRIGGMQLFRSESSDRSEKILPRVSQIASGIMLTYTALTALCAFLLYLAGMDVFDAACHAMCTVSTGGFSTKDASIGFYDSACIETIIMLFMFLGGSTLTLYVRALNGSFKDFSKDKQLKLYTIILVVASLIVTIMLWHSNEDDFLTSLRQSAFSVISLITTTGFVTSDFTAWGPVYGLVFFFLGTIGGCTGSTTGGIKIFRIQVIWSAIKNHIMQLRRPHGVFLSGDYSQKTNDSVVISVFVFIILYVVCNIFLAAVLGYMGLDFTTSLSGASACISNTGLGMGGIIGPQDSFAHVADGPKIAMILGMLLGRLELLTVILLFTPSFWRN